MADNGRSLLEEEKGLLLETLRLLGEAGTAETDATDRLFLILGINTYRMHLTETSERPMPPNVRRQITEGLKAIRGMHQRALRAVAAN